MDAAYPSFKSPHTGQFVGVERHFDVTTVVRTDHEAVSRIERLGYKVALEAQSLIPVAPAPFQHPFNFHVGNIDAVIGKQNCGDLPVAYAGPAATSLIRFISALVK